MAEKFFTPARAALGAAAAVAIAAIGIAVTRGDDAPAPPANSQAAGAPAGNVGDMVAQLEQKLRGNTTDADGWRMLGWAYFETGRYAESAGAYEKAAGIDPSKAEYWSAFGEATVLAERDGVSPKAEAAFRKAIAADPKDPRARYFLAVKKDLAGDHKGAVDDWIALLREAPADAPWAPDVRQLVQKVATDNKIDVAGRLPAAQPPVAGAGAQVAAAGIPGPTREQLQAASGLPPSQQDAMVKGMVDGLAARLAGNPKDSDGWIRLMRARMVLNDPPAAAKALESARAANPDARGRLDEAAKTLGVPGA